MNISTLAPQKAAWNLRSLPPSWVVRRKQLRNSSKPWLLSDWSKIRGSKEAQKKSPRPGSCHRNCSEVTHVAEIEVFFEVFFVGMTHLMNCSYVYVFRTDTLQSITLQTIFIWSDSWNGGNSSLEMHQSLWTGVRRAFLEIWKHLEKMSYMDSIIGWYSGYTSFILVKSHFIWRCFF